jgi:multiple sugar transport system substrate-binding protein
VGALATLGTASVARAQRVTPTRRRFLGGAAALAAGTLGAATGCGGSAQTSTAAKEPVTLSMLWVTRPGEEALWKDEYPRMLTKQHPNVTTSMEMVPASGDYWAGLLTKVVSLTAAGTPPDASRNAGYNARQLQKAGMMKDISSYTKTAKYPFNLHFNTAFPAHLKPADGKIYGLPVSILTVVRYVNKSLLAQIGLKAPADWAKDNWTLPQLLENARRLSRGSGADRTFGMRPVMNAMHGSHWFWTNGAEVIDEKGNVRITEAAALDTLQYGLEFYNQQISPSADDLKATPLNTMFANGRLAMFDAAQSSIPAIENTKPVFDWGLMPTSTGRTGKPFAVQFVDFWYVHAQGKKADASYQAIELLNSEEFEIAMARNLTGGVPTLKSVAQKFTKDLFKVDPDVSLNSLNHSREPYYAVKHLDWQALADKHAAQLWAGQVSARQAAENMLRESQAILAEDKS